MKKENLFEEYIKPEMVVIDVEMESAVLVGSPQEITENEQMENFGEWKIFE